MPVRCAVCETDNPEDASDCESCGSPLAALDSNETDAPVLAGLERTHAAAVEVDVDAMAGLEATGISSRDLQVEAEPLPGVEPTRLEANPAAPSNWTAGVDLDPGREPRSFERTTLPPESATCPFCGAASLDAVCDHCGRRKARFTAPSPLARMAALGETRLCPSCFARVPGGPRCEECGVPFPVQEL